MDPGAAAAPADVTVRLTYVGQKANQGLLLSLQPATARGTSTGTESFSEDSGVQKTAILELLADSSVDLQRWSPLWYDVRSKGWRDLETTTQSVPRPANELGTLDIRLVDRSVPGGCTPEGQLPFIGADPAAASGPGELVRRGEDAGGRGTAAVDEQEVSGYFGIGALSRITTPTPTCTRMIWQPSRASALRTPCAHTTARVQTLLALTVLFQPRCRWAQNGG